MAPEKERGKKPGKDEFEGLPGSLVTGLKAADRSVPMITAAVDRRVSAMAKAHFRERRQRIPVPRPAWAAIAATLIVAVIVGYWRLDPVFEQTDIYADVDRSGRIDIADVLALARSQEAGERSREQLDRFAAKVVSLRRPGEAS